MRIEIDTQQLTADIRTLEDRKEALSDAKIQVFRCIEEINAMWEGAAHDQFVFQVAMDSMMLQSLIGNIGHLVDCMEHARDEYNKCSDAVASKISSIRISNDT